MKKMLSLLLSTALLLSFAACGSNNSLPVAASSENASSDSAASSGFVIGFDQDDMPFSYLDDDGELVGFSVEVAREVCQQNGWEMVAEPIDWSTWEDVLETGTVDCVWGQATEADYYLDESDKQWLTFGEIYIDATCVIDSPLSVFSDLEGKTIAVDPEADFAIKGSSASYWGSYLGEKAGKVILSASAQQAYADLFSGKCDAVIINTISDGAVDFSRFEANADEDGYIMKSLYSSEDDETSETVYFRAAGACFSHYDSSVDMVRDTLYQLSADGTIQSIMKKWDNTQWGSLSKRFYVYDYGQQEEEFSEFDDEDELTDEELEELFGDISILDLEDEDL